MCAGSLLFSAASCSKKQDAKPEPGKITGTVFPAGAVATVTATDAAGANTAVTPTSAGEFSIANLTAGTYEVRFAAAAGYNAPADRSVSVAAGETNALGTITVAAYVAGGAVDGTCAPANSLRYIQLTAPGAQSGPTAQPDVRGYFRFENVAPGSYNVAFVAETGYLAPAPRLIAVVAGATTSLGVVAVNPAGSTSAALRGTLSWREGNTAYTSTSLTGNMFLDNGLPRTISLTATSLNGTAADVLGLYSGCDSPGLYVMSSTANTATYLRTYSGVPGASYETRYQPSPAGSLTVTAIDPVARTLSGTFGFTAAEAPLRTGRITISSGSFSLSY